MQSGNTVRSGSAGEPRAGSRGVILVVDDEESICAALAGALADEGYETLIAADGAEALRIIAEENPDLVFLDIWMPGLDGIDTLERIREAAPGTAVVMISGHATISNALEASRRGAFDFIEKPLDLDTVIFTAARAFEQIRARKELSGTPSMETKKRGAEGVFSHAGMLSRGLEGRNTGQRTIRRSILLSGQCLHTGQKSGLVLEPLPPDSGIHFAKIGRGGTIPAFVDHVQSTGFATTIRRGDSVAATVEHLLAVLHAYRVTNLLIKCNSEVPIFDGSALEFCRVLDEAGLEEQPGSCFEIAIDREIRVSGAGAREVITVSPAPAFSIEYELLYPEPVGRQYFEFTMSLDGFRREIAPARTFGFMKDIDRLQRRGLAAGGRLNNFILVGEDRVVNTDLRFPDEFVRHEILDVIGDLYLIGRPLRGKIHAKMTGHSDNIKLLTAIRELAVS
jgi:UDP-3-O-acyl N-acetylglucosamine deacetylase